MKNKYQSEWFSPEPVCELEYEEGYAEHGFKVLERIFWAMAGVLGTAVVIAQLVIAFS